MPLPLSKPQIQLGPSKDYWRLTTLIYALTSLVLIDCALSSLIKILALLALSIQYYRIFTCPKPEPRIQGFTLKKTTWVLHVDQDEKIYDKAQVMVDAGFFQLIYFFHEDRRLNKMILFLDQLQTPDRHRLQLKLHTNI